MKTFLMFLALAALVALSAARPRRGPPGGPRRGPRGPGRGGPRGGPGAILKRACRIEFQDGTIETKDCFEENDLFDCQKIELSEFSRIPRKWENATEISLCLPVTCTDDSECSGIDVRSKCIEGPPKPNNETREEVKRLRDTCHPRRQRPAGAEEDEDDLLNGESDDQPRRPRGRRPRPDANDDDEDEQSPRPRGRRPRPDASDDDAEDEQSPRPQGRRPRPNGDNDDEVDDDQSPRPRERRPRPDANDDEDDEQSPRPQGRRPRTDGDDDETDAELSPRQRGRRPRQDDDDETDADEQQPEPFLLGRKMCSIPPSYKIANKACRVEAGDGSVIRSRECRSRGNQTVACNATSACDVPYLGNDVKLYFCERPERPQGGNGPFGGNRQSGQEGEERRPRGRGNRPGRPGNGPRGGNAPQDGEGQTPENEQTVEEP